MVSKPQGLRRSDLPYGPKEEVPQEIGLLGKVGAVVTALLAVSAAWLGNRIPTESSYTSLTKLSPSFSTTLPDNLAFTYLNRLVADLNQASIATPSELIPSTTREEIRRRQIDKSVLDDSESLFTPLPPDPYSNAKLSAAITTHMKLSITSIDFAEKTISARVEYEYSNLQKNNKQLILDVDNLNIHKVHVNGQPIDTYIIQDTGSYRPNALIIPIPEHHVGSVTIHYTTKENAPGLFWLPKEMTGGKQHPIMFTQAEGGLGASWLPGQHTSQHRLTWEVAINTGSSELMALASSINNPTQKDPKGVYAGLQMNTEVPHYLFGIAVGDFAFHSYDKNASIGIYAESSHIKAAVEGFSRIPEFIQKGSLLIGRDYFDDWKVYRGLVLPQACPINGMAHACLSFFSGAVFDDPQVQVHEVGHSWFGNLVTSGLMDQQFWLNEGFGVYFESRISEVCLGKDITSLNNQMLIEDTKHYIGSFKFQDRRDLCKLCMPFNETTSVFSRVPYGKGFLFLTMLEHALGRKIWNKILADYIRTFAYNSMYHERFLKFLEQEILKYQPGTDFDTFMEQHQINEWLHGVDLPNNAPVIKSNLLDKVNEAVQSVLNGNYKEARKHLDIFEPAEMSGFLLLLRTKMMWVYDPKNALVFLEEQFHLTESAHSLIQREWAKLCASTGYLTKSTREMIKSYVINRNSKMIADIIATDLMRSFEGRKLVEEILIEGKNRMFTITFKAIQDAQNLARF